MFFQLIRLLLTRFLLIFLLAAPGFTWQDDIDLIFRHSPDRFYNSDDLTFLPSAQAELRLGRYLNADQYHGWLGGAEGDILLLSINKSMIWHWGLNMETLADEQNDIKFRLVQVYYQTKTGLAWLIGPGVWSIDYQHRCSHGADHAVLGRILIRSGLNSSYHWPMSLGKVHIDLRTSVNAYAIGQNLDLLNQARGGSQLNAQALWPIKGTWFMLLAGGIGGELFSAGSQDLYFLTSSAKNWRLQSLFGARIALRTDKGAVKNDYALHFSQVADTGLGKSQNKHSSLTFDINFYW